MIYHLNRRWMFQGMIMLLVTGGVLAIVAVPNSTNAQEKPQPKDEKKPETKPQPKDEKKPETKPQPKDEKKPETKDEKKPETKPEGREEARDQG